MKINLSGLPNILLNNYYKIFDRKKGLIQVLDMNDFILYPMTYAVLHQEVMELMCKLSKITNFNTLYLYNTLFSDAELFLSTEDVSFNIGFDDNCNLDLDSFEDMLKTKTKAPVFYPYDKVLIPNLTDLDLLLVDIEDASLSFLLVRKGIKNLNEIQQVVSNSVNKDETLEYINELSLDADLKSRIVGKCNL